MDLARSLAAGMFALVAATAIGDANAQQIFKIVGPDGRVTFSDKPPTDPGLKAAPAKAVSFTPDARVSLAGLPFELRQAASRYPVTLYTSPGCQTCAQGRQFLVSRGVPFAEKTVASKEDGDALMRLAGTQAVPLLTIGSQQLKGWADAEWSQFLDAAGYPRTSQLPSSYIPAPAKPLVALDQRPTEPRPAAAEAAAPAAEAGTAPAATGRRGRIPAPAATPPTDNPAGITF